MPRKRNLTRSKRARKILDRARLKMRAGLLEEAESDFKKVLKLLPNDVPALNNLGSIYLYRNYYEKALVYFDRALKVDRNNVFTLASLAIIHLLLYKDREQAMKYVTRAYERVISMDLDRFVSYFEYHGGGHLLVLISALGLLEEDKKIIELDKRFGLTLHSFLNDNGILNIAIAYANEGNYRTALNLMKSYGIGSNRRYSFYYNLMNFLLEHKIRLRLDYSMNITHLGILETPLWDKVMSCRASIFTNDHYYAFVGKNFSELAWALLSDEYTFYDKEVIIELLFATGRDDYALFLKTLLYSDKVPLDLKISLYVLATRMRHVLKSSEIKKIKDEKLREFIDEYHRVYVYNDAIRNKRDDVVFHKRLFDIFYKLYEKYLNHMIYMYLIIITRDLTILIETSKEHKNDTILPYIDKLIQLAKDSRNPLYMLDIVKAYSFLDKERFCKAVPSTILDALDLLGAEESLPIVYQVMLHHYINTLNLFNCEEDAISAIEKYLKRKKLTDRKLIELVYLNIVHSGFRKFATNLALLRKKRYKKYFDCTVSPNMQLIDLLSNYSVPLLVGIAKYLQSVNVMKIIRRRKKELIEDINTAVKNNLKEIIMRIKEKSLKDAFEYILKHHGIVEFNKFVSRYGSDKNDSTQWDYDKPKSVLGRLKLTGIVFTGKYQGKKIVFIPKEILSLLIKR